MVPGPFKSTSPSEVLTSPVLDYIRGEARIIVRSLKYRSPSHGKRSAKRLVEHLHKMMKIVDY